MPRAASPTFSNTWLRSARGPTEEHIFETNLQNTNNSSRGATHADIEGCLPDDEKEVINTYFRLVYPNLPPNHRCLIAREIVSFIETHYNEPKALHLLNDIKRTQPLPACSHFLEWIATDLKEDYDIDQAVSALKRVMKDNVHNLSSNTKIWLA